MTVDVEAGPGLYRRVGTGGEQVVCSRLLLVEGENDKRFLKGMLAHLEAPHPVNITVYRGKNNLSHTLRILRKSGAFRQGLITSVGVTRDADHQGCPAALQSLRGALYRAGLILSEKHITPANANLQISAHIICDSSGRGRLEEMILEAIEHHPWMADVDHHMALLRHASYPLGFDEGKTRLNLFLNYHAQCAPEGVHACLNFDHPVYDKLKGFLLDL